MKRRTQKSITALILSLVVLISMGLNTFHAKADAWITANVNIYMNGILQGTDVVSESDICELAYGNLPFGYLYGDVYGTYKEGTVIINGKTGFFLCFDNENAVLFDNYFGNPTAEDNIIINLYYMNDAVAAPIEYGTATFNIAYTNGTRCEGQEVLLTGIKGLDTITRTAVSDADGNAAAAELDMSYTWTCEFRGITYNVIFEDGLFHTDLCVPLPAAEQEPEVNENEEPAVENENENENKNTENLTPSVTIPEYEKNEENTESQNEKTEPRMFTISVTHYLNQAGGGTMVDGVPSGAFISFTESKQMEEGSVINVNDLWYMGAAELTLLDGSVVLYNGDTFTLGAKYMTGNNVHDVAADGSMVLKSDLTVTYSHTFQKQYLTVTMNYLDAETLEPVSDQEVRQFLASSSLEGAAEYDVTGMTPGYYRGYKVVTGYTYRTFEGDALTGEMDSDKVINFLFDKDAPIVEEPAEEEPVVEEPEEEPVVEEPEEEPVVEEPKEEPVIEEPKEEPVVEEPEEEPVVEEPKEEPVIEEPKEEPVVEEPEEEPVIEEPKEEPVVEEPEAEPVVEEPEKEPLPQVETPDRPISSMPNQEVVEDDAVKEEVVKEEVVLEEKEKTPVTEKTETATEEIVEIEEEEVPLAITPEEPELIDTKPESFGVWALLNLIALIATALTALGMILTNKKEKEEDSENENASEEEEEGKRKNSKLFGIIPAVVALVVFILTENMKLPMVIIDRWTLLMAVILLINLVLAYLTRRDKNQKEEAEVSSK